RVLHASFSPDGEKLAYVARRGQKHLVVFDGMEGREYDQILERSRDSCFTFSPDGKHLAYLAMLGGKQILVVDGKESELDGGIASLTFSPGSSRFAYQLSHPGNKCRVVIDGTRGQEYSSVSNFTFSSDSEH